MRNFLNFLQSLVTTIVVHSRIWGEIGVLKILFFNYQDTTLKVLSLSNDYKMVNLIFLSIKCSLNLPVDISNLLQNLEIDFKKWDTYCICISPYAFMIKSYSSVRKKVNRSDARPTFRYKFLVISPI